MREVCDSNGSGFSHLLCRFRTNSARSQRLISLGAFYARMMPGPEGNTVRAKRVLEHCLAKLLNYGCGGEL